MIPEERELEIDRDKVRAYTRRFPDLLFSYNGTFNQNVDVLAYNF